MNLTSEDTRLWRRLSTRSRRALMKTRHRYSRKHHGRPYVYSPRGDLLCNLVAEGYAVDIDDALVRLKTLRFKMFSLVYPPDKARELAYNARIY